MHYSQVNYLMDVVMPASKPNTFKVISTVARQTWGFNKDCCEISFSEFMTFTGIKNKTTLSNAIQNAIDEGYISRSESSNTFNYCMMPMGNGTETVPNELAENGTETVPDGTEIVPERYRNRTDIGTEIVPNQSSLKEKENKHNYHDLAKAFEIKTGITAKPQKTYEWQDKWQVVLEGMLERAKNYDHAVEVMEQSVDILWKKKYPILSPDSILKTYVNLIGMNKANGTKSTGGSTWTPA